MSKKSVTIKEIADIAGVSVATVSYVLNGKKKISEKTRTKVLAIVQQLNYTPNLSAQNLRTQDSKLVFALVNSINSSFNTEILAKIDQKFDSRGYQLLTLTGKIPEVIRTNIFDGGIVLNYNLSFDDLEDLARHVHKKMVILSGSTPLKSASIVSMDNESGMTLILEELYKSPHKRICFICGPSESINNQERLAISEKIFKSLFQRDDFSIHVYNGFFNSDAAYEVALKLMKSDSYDAFVCFNDSMALGVYQAAAELGLKIGEDISVTGFDNIFFSRHLTPGLTTVAIDKDSWAEAVVETYLAFNDENHEPTITKIPASLKKRKSIQLRDNT
ncbi:LacI family DNA-binding transcriptional regulator [Enterococcus asini]|uniref:LacI family DNA-binding transcriptional regulator n=1 Tax=Enterococcus asini TaxID=57732 RepID=UPI0032E3E4BA